jgi:hypothetical protein
VSKRSQNARRIATAFWVVGSLVTAVWLTEIATVGRGFVSTYLAPLAFGPLLLAAIFFHWSLRAQNVSAPPARDAVPGAASGGWPDR